MMRIAALSFALVLAGIGPAPAAAADDQEAQMGAQVYQQLQQKGEIIPRPNAMYDALDPIAARIAKVTDPQYQYPFRFVLVHEKQPNAFAVPGGNVYVTDSLMQFVKNREELAGVLCHETSHTIHHDVANLNAKSQTQGALIGILGSLLGMNNSMLGQFSEGMLYKMQTSRFSREVESSADLKGSETCAQAGLNPHGMVWLFDAFEKTGGGGNAEFIADHPTDAHRVAALEAHFKSNPDLFGKYSSDIASGTPMPAIPREAMQPPGQNGPNGYPGNGYPGNGYPPNGQPNGNPPQGYPGNGYPPQGYPGNGYPPQGYPPNGNPPGGPPPGGSPS
jgi:beta-barrel assembly-enhancing protease